MFLFATALYASTFSGPTELSGAAQFGCRVGEAGDVNGDGFADLLVSDCSARTVSVFHGSSSGISTTAAVTLTGEGGGLFGASLGGGGDLNADGYDDVVVGAPRARRGRGCVYVFYGSSTGLSNVTTPLRCGATTTDTMGGNVGVVGDLNGDGIDDMAWGAMSGTTGNLRVHHGSTSGISSVASRSLTLSGYTNGSGEGVRGAGDVNGDGYGDLVVGSPVADSDAGSIRVYFGSAVGVTPTNMVQADLAATYGAYPMEGGYAVDGAGDYDGDGYGDLLVGIPYSNGTIALLWGSPTGVSWSDWDALYPDYGYDPIGVRAGHSVAGEADFNGDARPDFIATLPGGWWGSAWGSVAAWDGASVFEDTPGWQVASSTASFGISSAVLGDVNGDGCDDVAVGQGLYPGYREADYTSAPLGYAAKVYYATSCPRTWDEADPYEETTPS